MRPGQQSPRKSERYVAKADARRAEASMRPGQQSPRKFRIDGLGRDLALGRFNEAGATIAPEITGSPTRRGMWTTLQ